MTIGFIILILVVILLIAIAWASGIDMMKQQHPDYKGEDFLNWDDDKNHTEGSF